jgi:hypothetical protein
MPRLVKLVCKWLGYECSCFVPASGNLMSLFRRTNQKDMVTKGEEKGKM